MQVYNALRVLTARPSEADEARTPHRLYGHVPAQQAYSAGRFAHEAAAAARAVIADGRVPIFVGGTGLYFRVLTEGLSPIPAIPDAIRQRWRAEAADRSALELHGVLAGKDTVMAARLVPSDRQRVVRALEVIDATGRSLAEWQEMPGVPVLAGAWDLLPLVVRRERAALYRRADERFAAMLNEGAIEEVRALMALELSGELPVMRALGVRPIVRMLAGELARSEAISLGQIETRQYIKRQLTWLRRYMISWSGLEFLEYNEMGATNVRFVRDWIDRVHARG